MFINIHVEHLVHKSTKNNLAAGLVCVCVCGHCVLSVYSTSTLHHLVDFALYVELWVFGLHTFQLDGYFLSNRDIST